nr:MAG TPA: hypothetical protein [Caudoviricetes sp.]
MRYFQTDFSNGIFELYCDAEGFFHYRRIVRGASNQIIYKSEWQVTTRIPTYWKEI